MTGRLPDFLVVGAPRSGTTSLSQYLAAHPGVFMSATKELNFFNRVEPTSDAVEVYRKHFAAARPDQRAGEATPLYLFSKEAHARMATVVPEARLVAILREPVSRAYSHYWLRTLWGAESRTFADAAEAELRGEALRGVPYLACGRYFEQLVRLCGHFPRSSVEVFILDDLERDAGSVFAALARHIGADPSIQPPNVGRRYFPAAEARSVRLSRSMGRWRLRREKRYAWARLLDRVNRREGAPEPMDPALRRRLLDYFSDPNAALAAWLGRDLTSWSR